MDETSTKSSYCRICEPMCGLQIESSDGRVVKVRASKNHVLSRGHLCAKAQAASEVSYDPDRVLQPLKRNRESGQFEPLSWPQAIHEIAEKLSMIRKRSGHDSFATYAGNPMAFASSSQIWLGALKKILGVRYSYGVGAEDTVAPMVAASILYGSLGSILKPDLWRTDFVLVIGANPYVSHSSLFTEPLLRQAFTEIKDRGGRVIVVDPRQTETAKKNEFIGIRAGTDAYLLSAMLQTIYVEKLLDIQAIEEKTEGLDDFLELLVDITPELASTHTGIDAEVIRQLARDFANADSACVIGRTGTCTQRFGTLSNLLFNILCLLTGNVDTEGGMLFGDGLVDLNDFLEKSGANNIGEPRSRTTGQISVAGHLPSIAMPSDILEPGKGQIRALLSVAANPMLNSPAGGDTLRRALEDLELHVSMDLYINETNQYADYILPVTTMYERQDMPIFGLDAMLRPAIWATEAVAEPQGEVKQEWQIYNALAKAMGLGGCYESGLFRLIAKLGYEIKPKFIYDLLIRTSAWGDRFGLRPGGLSFKKLIQDYPDGYQLMESLPTGRFVEKMGTDSKRIDLGGKEIRSEMLRLRDDEDNYMEFPYRLISQREMLSQNSWLHNVNTTMQKEREQTAKVHPVDAHRHGLVDGKLAKIKSPWGEVIVPIKILSDMQPGNVALPHGWGHKGGGWRRANEAGGVSSNILASDQPVDCEAISGGSTLNGIPINMSAISNATNT